MPSRNRGTEFRGFTLIELLVVMSIIALLLSILVPSLGRARRSALLRKDAQQIKSIHQAWMTWATENHERYPTPGLVNRLPDPLIGTDVQGRGPEDKLANNTSNIHSVAIMHNFYSPDTVVSSTEPNGNVGAMQNYDFAKLDIAGDVYWDDDFECDLQNECNVSYASMVPIGDRKKSEWGNSGRSDYAILSNRGPMMGDASITNSLTFEIHGGGKSWIGNVCWQDNHMSTEETLFPENCIYRDSNGQTPDSLFNVDCTSGVCDFWGGDTWLVIASELTGSPDQPVPTLEWDDE